MGVESIGVESAHYGPRRSPHFEGHINRQSQGSLGEVQESKELKYWTGANRMGPCVFGSPMAAQAGERSKSEGIHSSSENSSGSFRFGASTGASSLSSTDAGHVSRTVSVSELFAFRNKGGKVSDRQMPTVFKCPMPVTSSFSISNLSSCGMTISSSSMAALPNSPPSVVSSRFSLAVDGREFSAASSNDAKYDTSSFSDFTTGLKPSTSSRSSSPFVFTAGASDKGPFTPGTQKNVRPGCLFSGSWPASQSNIPMDGLFSGKSRPGVQANGPLDSSLSGSIRPACPANLSNDTCFLGSSEPTVVQNIYAGNISSVPSKPATSVSSSAASAFVGSSYSSSPSNISFKMQSAGSPKPTEEADISFEELLVDKTAHGVVGGLSKHNIQRNRFAGADQGVAVDISRKLNQLDIDRGINLLHKLETLGLDKDREMIVKPAAFAPETEVEQSLEKLDIGEGHGLPLKLEKLGLNKEIKDSFSGVNSFVFGGRSTSTSGDRAPSSAKFVFGAACRADSFPECTGNQRSESIPATGSSSSLKFSADGEIKTRVSKVIKCKFQHRLLRPGHRSNVRGKNGASTTSSDRSMAATQSPSGDGVSMDIRSGYIGFNKSLVPEYDEGDIDKVFGGASDVNPINPMAELEASIQKIRGAVSGLNFGAGCGPENETSSSVPISHVVCGTKDTREVLNSASSGQGWKRTPAPITQSVERPERENRPGEQVYPMNKLKEREDVNNINAKKSASGWNEDGTENSRGSGSSNLSDDGQHKAEGEAKESPFTFTACPTGMSMSNLRLRPRKSQRSVGKMPQSNKARGPVLQPDGSNCRLLSTMKSDILSGTSSLGGIVGSGYREGVNASGVGAGGGSPAAEQVCERWRLRGNQAYAKGDFVKAEEFYSLGAGSVSPHETSQSCIRASMLCYSNRAATRMVVGRMREALADCMHAMALDPSFVRVRLRAAGCHLALGETELAAIAFKDCSRRAQEASKVDSKVLADVSEGLKKVQQVVEYCTQGRNLLYNSPGDLVTALRLLNEALLGSPHSECLLELKVHTLISLQRFTEAVQVCEQSLALAERNFPNLERTSNRFANTPLRWRRRMTIKANFHLGKLEEALEQLHQLGPSSLFSSDLDLPGALSTEMALPSMELIRELLHYKLEGNKAFQAGNFTEALVHYTAALGRNGESRPFCAVCLCNRAAASQALGYIADAIADCSRAIALDPRYAKAISRRASLHEIIRDYGQSCCDLRRLIALYERHQTLAQGARISRVDVSAGSTTVGDDELQLAKGRLLKAEEDMKKDYPLDHYSILGLEVGCSASEIKKAYRKAALRHHPDKASQFLMRTGESGDDPLKYAVDGTDRKDGERLIDEVRKDSEQLFKLIGEAYAVLSDPAKRSRYDSEEDLRKCRSRSSDLFKNGYADRKNSQTSDGVNAQTQEGWSPSSSAGEPGSQSRARRQRERWDGFNSQYQRWHPGPDAAQPDVYARRGRPSGSTYGSSHRSNSWRWEEYPWDDM